MLDVGGIQEPAMVEAKTGKMGKEKDVVRLEREAVISIMKPKLIMKLACLIGTMVSQSLIGMCVSWSLSSMG